MKLIIGGAYQGKLDFAKAAYPLEDGQIFHCTDVEIDFSKPCITNLEEFTYACAQRGIEPLAYFQAHRAEWENSVLICQDIFCGVVPMGAELRTWRRITGQLCQYLSKEAETVTRIFCGLPQRLK